MRVHRSVWSELEQVLPLVSKPVQYIGGELNTVGKPWEQARVRWVLTYPDAYEVGASNQGMQILYEILNELPDVLAERAYAVWPDLEALMRDRKIPAFAVDSHTPLNEFDFIGVSFSTELCYTNLLTSLDLAGIPLHARDRGDCDPLVVMGGHAAFNPEPMASFVDAVVLGDGEQPVIELSRILDQYQDEMGPRPQSSATSAWRSGLLERIAASGVAYVPAFYDVAYGPDGAIARVVANNPVAPFRVAKHTLMDLDDWPYPRNPVVPIAETVHERLSVEIFRGCTRGCRFCQAGMITRPVRERTTATLGKMIDNGLDRTGFAEVGMLSLSSADHSEIAELTAALGQRYAGSNVSLSLPSTRVDAFNIELANELSRNGRRSGLTFAPEGGSERIRNVINKGVTEADLIATVSAAYSAGWRQVKLYFMCGLPTETDEDVLQIAQLARAVIAAGRAASGSRDISCTVSIGGFIPKPHTPFQWAAQLDHQTTDARLRKLRDAIRADRQYSRAIGFRYHDGRPGIIEGLLSRGDRRVGAVIEAAWRSGARFDGWSEYFSFDRWMAAAEQALSGAPVDVAWFTTRERDRNEVLPWDHLDAGLDREWLWEDWQDALSGGSVGDCRWSPCSDCGVCDQLGTDIQVGPRDPVLIEAPVVPSRVLADGGGR